MENDEFNEQEEMEYDDTDNQQTEIKKPFPYNRERRGMTEAQQAFAEDYARHGDEYTFAQYGQRYGVSSSSIQNYLKRYPDIRAHIEKTKKEIMRIDLSNIETLSLQQLSELRHKIMEREQEIRPENNFTLALRRKLEKTQEEKDRKQLFNEIIGVMEEFDLHPEENYNTITCYVRGVPSDIDLKSYCCEAESFERWCSEILPQYGIVLPDSWKIIKNIFLNTAERRKIKDVEAGRLVQ